MDYALGLIETRNTTYEMGVPNPEYVKYLLEYPEIDISDECREFLAQYQQAKAA